MNDIEVKKTYFSDFERIYPLLQEFNSPYSMSDWKKIFSYQWEGAEDYVGFHLEHKENVVGFMGLIFSCRNREDHRYKFCNITSLIVKKEYRAATLFLLRKLKTLEQTILTGLRPIEESYRILKLMGFQDYEQSYKIIPAMSQLTGKNSKMTVYDFPHLLENLDKENQRIVRDHVDLSCEIKLFIVNEKKCLLIYKKQSQKHYKINIQKILLLYISDVNFFNENSYGILKFFRKKIGFFSAIYIDNRFLQNKKIFSFSREISPPRIYYNPHLNQIALDELYSEAILL